MLRSAPTTFVVLMLLCISPVGCVNVKKTTKSDKRTHNGSHSDQALPQPEIPDANPSDTPSTTPDILNPESSTQPYLLPDGEWQIERVTCSNSATETLDSIWSYSQKNSVATFSKKSTGGCQHHQDAKISITDRKLAIIPGQPRCEGACTTECKPLIAEGSEFIVAVDPGAGISGNTSVSGSILLKPGLPFINDFCPGRQPANIFMSPKSSSECEQKWQSEFGNGSMQIGDGLLRWNIPAIRKLQSHTLILTRELSGDFSIEVHYKGLEVLGRGAYFKAAIVDTVDPRFQAYVMAGNYSTGRGENPMHLAAVVLDGNYIDPPNSAVEGRGKNDGIMAIEKRGTKVKVFSYSEGDTPAEKSNADDKPFSNGKYQLILSLGSNSNLADINEVTSVNVDLVSIKDGAGKTLPSTDLFDCNSIK